MAHPKNEKPITKVSIPHFPLKNVDLNIPSFLSNNHFS